MADDFDVQLADAFKEAPLPLERVGTKKSDKKRGRPKGEKGERGERGERGEGAEKGASKKSKRRKGEAPPVAPANTPEDEGAHLPMDLDPAEAGSILEKEADDLTKQILRYCDTFPEHAGNTRATVESGSLSVPELQFELAQITRRVNKQQELAMMRSGLITGCAAIEFGSSFIPGQPVKLQGFSGSVSADIESFDVCLKQIMCKYGNEFVMSVESTLGLMLAMHAFTTHRVNAAKPPPPPIKEEREENHTHSTHAHAFTQTPEFIEIDD